jgi:hypothetical protein
VEGRPGAARIAAAPGRLSSGERKKKGKGRGEADRRGPVVSVYGKKKKKKETGRCGRGLMGHWAAGLDRRGGFLCVFFYFFKLFSNHTFKFKFRSKLF